MDICLSPARAEASRRNGAKSRGPRTAEGKARSAQNALTHGFRAQKHMVLRGEDAAAFKALEAALLEELAPEGALQSVLAQRIVSAAWRLERAERLEAELFERNHFPGGDLGLALIRDCNGGARSFDTLLRYRGGTLAEFWRALRTLKALQADQAMIVPATEAHARPAPEEEALGAPDRGADAARPCQTPIEPEARINPCETASAAAGGKAVATATPALPGQPAVPGKNPIEPEARGNPGETAPAPAADAGRARRTGTPVHR